MRILGIESSCDETSAAIIEGELKDKKSLPAGRQVKLLSNIVATSLALHAKTGGIIPEVAARQQIRYVIPVIENVLGSTPGVDAQKIDAIAVTVGPGLIGSLLVGVETAKTLSFAWNKPLIPVNHLIGHIYANFVGGNPKLEIRNPKLDARRYQLDAGIRFPAIALIVSGGHTDLVFMKSHGKINWLGGTRDDAAGEAFDKIARLLGLSYPGGPAIEKAAEDGNPKAFNFPRPMLNASDFSAKGGPVFGWDFSFSGLKTAVYQTVQSLKTKDQRLKTKDLAASVQQAIIDVLVAKTLKAAEKYKAKSILLSGGVTANQKLRDQIELDARRYQLDAKIFAPQKSLCTDNAAMIASAAFFNYKPVPWQKITANPELYFD